MASSINASTSGAGGVITSADNSGILNIQTAGTTAVTVDASQNVGIGTTSPAQKFDVAGKVNIDTSNTYGKINLARYNGALVNYIQGTDATGSANGLYLVYGGGNAQGMAFDGTNILFYNNSNTTERMRIDSSGNLLVGATSQFGSGLICSVYDSTSKAGFAIKQTNNSVGTFGAFYNYTGALQGYINNNNNGTVSYVTTSDYRLKENVEPLTSALNTISKLKPSKYNFIGYDQKMTGFIAHELQEILPEAVSGEKDAVNEDGSIKPQGIDTSFLVATLTAAIQEQQAIITQLQADVAALKGTK